MWVSSKIVVPVLVAAFPFSGASAQEFPVTVEHAFGTVTIPQRPERIATVAWANHEVPIALGIVPVGMAAATFGDDDGNGILPWVEERLAQLGGPPPVLFDEGDGIDFEAVAASDPDVILAAYSGLSQADYDMLGKIAPVIAFPDTAWGTDWRQMIRLNSAGMGMSVEGERLIADLDRQIADAAAARPQLAGKTAMFVTHLDTTDLSMVRFYSRNDARVKFFEDLGLTAPASVTEASTDGSYSGEISAERIDMFDDVDIVVTYGGPALIERLAADPLASRMPAVAKGSVVLLGSNPLGTAANPTPLSIPWVLEDYADLLADAASKSE